MNKKAMSSKQENKVAKETGGNTTIASGALYFQKADVRLDNYLIECKTTQERFYTLKRNVWEKIQKEALKDSMRIPLIQIDLEDGLYRVAILDYNDFLSLDLDENIYIKWREETYKKSIRIRMLEDEEVCLDSQLEAIQSDKPFHLRKDIVFKDKKKRDLHLVVLEWEDFLMLMR